MAKLVAVLVVVGTALPAGLQAQQPEQQKAREIISAAIVAKGGKDRLQQFPAWHVKYRETFVRDGKKSVEVGELYEHLARGQARYQTGPDDFIILNGKQGWIKNGKKVTALTAGQIADFQEYLKGKEAMLAVLPLLTDEWQVAVRGGKDVDGHAAVAIRITRKDWTATTYWDKKTHLLVCAEYPHKRLIEPDDAKRKATTRKARFTDYQAVEGILFHTKLLAFSGGKQSGEVEFTSVEMLKRLPDAAIARPR